MGKTLTQVQGERQATYGPWRPNMEGTSLQFDGLLKQYVANNPGADLPDWFAPLCMIAVKLNRIASGKYHADNFTDLRNYLHFVEQMQLGADAMEDVGPTTDAYTPPCKAPEGFRWAEEYRRPRKGEWLYDDMREAPHQASLNFETYEHHILIPEAK